MGWPEKADFERLEKEFEEEAGALTLEQKEAAFERTRLFGVEAMRHNLRKQSKLDGATYDDSQSGVPIWRVDYPEELLDDPEADAAFLRDAPDTTRFVNELGEYFSGQVGRGSS